MTPIQIYARAVVDADMALFVTEHLIRRVREFDPEYKDLPEMNLTAIREQLTLDGAIALLGTCEGAFDDQTLTEDGKVIRAYSLAVGDL